MQEIVGHDVSRPRSSSRDDVHTSSGYALDAYVPMGCALMASGGDCGATSADGSDGGDGADGGSRVRADDVLNASDLSPFKAHRQLKSVSSPARHIKPTFSPDLSPLKPQSRNNAGSSFSAITVAEASDSELPCLSTPSGTASHTSTASEAHGDMTPFARGRATASTSAELPASMSACTSASACGRVRSVTLEHDHEPPLPGPLFAM